MSEFEKEHGPVTRGAADAPRPGMDDVELLRSLGLRPVINARGDSSVIGQSRPSEAAIAAMVAAARNFVPVVEIQAWASRVIARVTGAEAGCVASGCSACVYLATVACMTGADPAAMRRFPDTTGLRDEIVMHRVHRNAFDHAVRAAGARLVEFGLPIGLENRPFSWELEEAITDRTAAVFYVHAPGTRALPLRDTVEIAHGHGIPVIVDAAGSIPPPSNLRRFIDEGADLVAYSGGKGVGGPSGAGFLAGRRDLILSATIQQQDMNVRGDTWEGPLAEPDPAYPLPPLQGAGRMLKVGREEMVGLVVRLQEYAAQDHEAIRARLVDIAARVQGEIGEIDGVTASLNEKGWAPSVVVRLAGGQNAARAAFEALRQGEPRVYCHEGGLESGSFVVGVSALSDAEVDPLLRRLGEVLGARAADA
jgi:D-glucosaminate-6-phosphate ammonia-lyase